MFVLFDYMFEKAEDKGEVRRLKIDLSHPPSTFILLIVPRRYVCYGSICFMFWRRICVLFEPYVHFHILFEFELLSGRLLGSSCSLDLRYVF